MLMHLSSLPIVSDLLVSLEDDFYQRLLRSATCDIKTSLLKYKVQRTATFLLWQPKK